MGSLLLNLSLAATAQVEAQQNAQGDTIPLIAIITVFVLSVFLGFEVISKVPATLHTPLMSGTNAIHGIVLVGAMIVAGVAGSPLLIMILAFIAVVFGAGNVVGGFVVTDRMLQMFRKRPQPGGKK
ncbi:MAG TPA: NAD(P) transhydrogenase subunit alpha [Chloroflexia bacterium]|nr:NAD(P) transhydrogenase subunit alpha [Chloroflexia bacterium]